jgi:N-acetylneuraminic acid mutarotase
LSRGHSFESRTVEALDGISPTEEVQVLDHDHDGLQDLVLRSADSLRLLHNRGDATFECVELVGPTRALLLAGIASRSVEAVSLPIVLDPRDRVLVPPAVPVAPPPLDAPGQARRRPGIADVEEPSPIAATPSSIASASSLSAIPFCRCLPSGAMVLADSPQAPAGFSSTGCRMTARCGPEAWSAGTPRPITTYRFGAAALDGKIYAVGGQKIGGAPPILRADLDEYDPVMDSWTSRPPMNIARSSLAVVTAGGRLYAIGGLSGSALATLEEYDPVSMARTTKTPMPTPRFWFFAAEVGGKIYAIGGYNGSDLATVERYDPLTDSWSARAPLPAPKRWAPCGVLDGKIYVVGGGTTTSVERYDPATDTWESRASFNHLRDGHVVVSLHDRLFTLSGYDTSTGYSFVRSVEEYDPLLDTWTVRPSLMPTGREAPAAAAVDGKVFVIGGLNAGVNEIFESGYRTFHVHRRN